MAKRDKTQHAGNVQDGGGIDDEDDLTDEQIIGILAPVAARIANTLAAGGGSDRGTILEMLRTDESAAHLLAAAFESGKAEVARDIVINPQGVTISKAAPDWTDVESTGERKARHREESICARCIHSGVCRVATAAPIEMLVTVRRCLAFVE